jgi:hypothetical protein
MLARFFVLDRVGEEIGCGGCCDFGLASGKYVGRGHYEAEGRAKSCAGRIGAGLDEKGNMGAFLEGAKGVTRGKAGVEATVYSSAYFSY